MSDLPTFMDYSKTTFSTLSPECLAVEVLVTGTNNFAATNAWTSANLALFVPWKLGSIYIVNKMFWGNGATVGTNHVDVGIYDIQGNQLVHSGSTLTSGVSVVQSVSLTATTLYPGLYYIAMAMDGTTDTIQSNTANSVAHLRAMGILMQTTAFPLPATATLVGNTVSSKVPFIAVTSGTII